MGNGHQIRPFGSKSYHCPRQSVGTAGKKTHNLASLIDPMEGIMTRYVQQQAEVQPKKEAKPERQLPKTGKYTSKELEASKKKPLLGGGSWRQA